MGGEERCACLSVGLVSSYGLVSRMEERGLLLLLEGCLEMCLW